MSANREKLRFFISDSVKKLSREPIFTDNDNLFDKGLVNSLFAMKLVRFLEKQFQITVEEDDLDLNNFCSINNMMNFVKRKMIKSDEDV